MAPASLNADWRRELIVTLAEEDPFCPEPPAEAAEAWTEARIRAFFQAGGADACEAAVPVAATQVRARRMRQTRHQLPFVAVTHPEAAPRVVPDASGARRRRASTRRPMQTSSHAGFPGWAGAQRRRAVQRCA